MDEVMKALDEALHGLVIVLCAEYERKKCIFISPPGESSLNLNSLVCLRDAMIGSTQLNSFGAVKR